jgi:hypothetical protein
MQARHEAEGRAGPGDPRIERPAGEHAGQRRDVLLGVAAVDTERVELHQFARIIFVEAGNIRLGAGNPRSRIRARHRRQPVVEIEQHRRVFRGRPEQVAEFAQDVGPDRLAFVIGDQDVIEALAGNDVEMIEPELVHDLLELPRAVDRPGQPQLAEMDGHLLVERVAHGYPAARCATAAVIHRRLDDAAIGRDQVGLRHLTLR